jgi:hypothetical protein
LCSATGKGVSRKFTAIPKIYLHNNDTCQPKYKPMAVLLTGASTAASRIEKKHFPIQVCTGIIKAATAAVAKQYRAKNRIDIALAPMSEMSHC